MNNSTATCINLDDKKTKMNGEYYYIIILMQIWNAPFCIKNAMASMKTGETKSTLLFTKAIS
jgi:hypothetical protein